MIYDTRRQSDRVEDELVNLAVLGLLEIKGQTFLRESEERNKTEAAVPGENKVRFLEREIRRRERAEKLRRMGKKLSPFITRAAVIFMALCLSTGSVLIVSADAREFLYKLLIHQHERYMVIEPDRTGYDHFDNLEEYQQAGAKYAPTYIPERLSFHSIEAGRYTILASYQRGDQEHPYLLFSQSKSTGNGETRWDNENLDYMGKVSIGDSEALVITKNGDTAVIWNVGDTMFDVITDLPAEEAIKFARGVKSI